MNQSGRVRIVLAAVMVLAAIGFYFYSERTGPPPEALTLPEVPEDTMPEPRHPVPQQPGSRPEENGPDADAPDPESGETEPEFQPRPVMPALEESDPAVTGRMQEWLGDEAAGALLSGEDLVRRMVATIHSLDGGAVPLRVRPVVPPPEGFRAGEPQEEPETGERFWVLDPGNAERYETHLDALRRIDPETAAEVYLAHYDWFQRAYAELGDSDAYFNDRLVEIIDHLLEAPSPENGTRLVRPKVFFEYADPALENQSWGRKALMRLGPEQRSVVMAWLRAFRTRIAAD